LVSAWKTPFFGCHGHWGNQLNPEGNKQSKERDCLIRSLREGMFTIKNKI